MYCPNPECPDYLEDGFPGEYVETVSVCPKCGTRLVAGPTPDRLDADSQNPGGSLLGRKDDPPAEVASFGSRQDADLAASYLVAHGIEATVAADDAGGEFAGVDLSVGARVLVATSRVTEALALLEATGSEGDEN